MAVGTCTVTCSSSAAPAAFSLLGHVVGLGVSGCLVPAPLVCPYKSVHRRSSGICQWSGVHRHHSGVHLPTFLKRNCGLKDFHPRAQGQSPGGGTNHRLPDHATLCPWWALTWPGPPTTGKTLNLLHCQTLDFLPWTFPWTPIRVLFLHYPKLPLKPGHSGTQRHGQQFIPFSLHQLLA